MKFTSKTDEELDKEGLTPEGFYDFEVIKAEEKVSKNGVDMIQLKLRIFAPVREAFLNDWLVASYVRKIAHFAKVTGLESKYLAGVLTAADCMGKTGQVHVGIRNVKMEDSTLKAFNYIEDYCKNLDSKDKDDSIPF